MKIQMFVSSKENPETSWLEVVSTDCNCLCHLPSGESPERYAQEVIDYFNRTLKPGESPRTLVSAMELT